MTKPANRVFEFGPFRLETAERLLLRAGARIPLTPKAFETLLALVQNSGRLVEKDDLMKQVWRDAIVEEANLARNIWALRKALRDGNGADTYIETIPKVGYRFVAAVTELPVQENGNGIQRPPEKPRAIEEEDKAPKPPAALPSKVRDRPWVLAVLGAVALASVVLVGVWPGRTPSTRTDASFTFLTDGSHDDVGAYWLSTGQIYFSRSVTSTRTETWTMNADGTNQRRANTGIKSLLTGRWSPDGKKVVFRKDDGTQTNYLADADGGHEIALRFAPGNLDWSPDSSQFVYQARTSPEVSEVFLYTVATDESVSLTPGVASADPSFSNDGTRIAFTSWRDGNAEIYVMDPDGSHVRRVTNHPAFDNYPVFSPDGTQMAFQSNREDERVEIYLQNLNDETPPKRLTHSSGRTGLMPKCWSPDGTRMLVYTSPTDKDLIELINVHPVPAPLLLGDDAADLNFPRVSRNGKALLYEARLADRSLELRMTDVEPRRTRVLFRTEPGYPIQFHLTPAWSPDNSLIAFSSRANGNSEIFTVKADGSGLRNVTNNPLLDSSPVFSSDGTAIVFARDTYGRAQLFRMDVNGSGQRRVTDTEGYEMNPAVSPDGVHLAFAGDRASRGLDILLLSLTAPGDETLLTGRPSQDSSPAFSPDGKSVAFTSTSDGHPEIYVVNTDGTGLVRVTHSTDEKAGPQFSADGRRIVFSSNRGGRFALYQIDAR